MSEKWAEMTQDQRDELVAKRVMGWTPGICDGEWGEQPNSSDGWYCMKCGYEGHWGAGFEHENIPPRYTVSMNAAWQVVEKMVDRMGYQNNGFEWYGPIFKAPNTYTSSYTNDGPNNHTGHLFYTKAGGDSGTLGETCWYVRLTLDGRYWTILADTPHEAICLAALKTVGWNESTAEPS